MVEQDRIGLSGAAESAGVDHWDALRGLSVALDLVMGRKPGHAQATSALGLLVGRHLGLGGAELADLALTALLKDAGCAASRATFTAAVGTDDIAFHRRVFGMDRYSPATFAALLWDLQRQQSDRATSRVRGWTHSLLGLKQYQRHFAARNAEAARLAEQLRCPIGTIGAIGAVGEHWDGSGNPGQAAGTAIPIAARIVTATQMATIWGEDSSASAVADRLTPLAGSRLDPAVVRSLQALLGQLPTNTAGEWLDTLIVDLALEDSPLLSSQSLTAPILAGIFAEIVDTKSAFTAQHSHRVAALAGAMARLTGASERQVEAVLLAGMLHDLGKLGVSNLILDKPAPLDNAEWLAMRQHPSDSARVLRNIPGWSAITAWAASHHERPDGRGYHLQRAGATIPLVGRWLAAADAFDAMTADRPYRQGMDPAEALRRLQAGQGTQFDPQAVLLLTGVVENRPLPQLAPDLDGLTTPTLPPSSAASEEVPDTAPPGTNLPGIDSPYAAVPIAPTRTRHYTTV
jgi:putative nucleotidyltransferase with HDIG domain